MELQLDVGKLVGAASAPVALVIATSIFLGNLGGKHAMYMAIYRDLGHEYRAKEQRDTVRSRSIERQIELYAARMRSLMRATFWLTVSLLSFLITVVFTFVGVIFPAMRVWIWLTAIFGMGGMSLLATSVVIEMVENHRSRCGLALEAADVTNVGRTHEDEEEVARLYAGEHNACDTSSAGSLIPGD